METAYLHVKSIQEKLNKITPPVPEGASPPVEDSTSIEPIFDLVNAECDDLVTAFASS